MEDHYNYNYITAKPYKILGLVKHTLSHTIDIEIKKILCLVLAIKSFQHLQLWQLAFLTILLDPPPATSSDITMLHRITRTAQNIQYIASNCNAVLKARLLKLFWKDFTNNFSSDNVHSFHFICPCSNCSKSSHPPNFD